MSSSRNHAITVVLLGILSLSLTLGLGRRSFAQTESGSEANGPTFDQQNSMEPPHAAEGQESGWVDPGSPDPATQAAPEEVAPESGTNSDCSGSACDAQPEDSLPGFKANEILGGGPVDHVGVYSGDTGIIVPLGPTYELGPTFSWQLKAYDTIHFWHTWEQDQCAGSGANVVRGVVRGLPTIGLGWWLHLGYVAFPDFGLGPFPDIGPVYVSPDGAQHLTNASTGVTIDGTHLRVICSGTPTTCKVYFPDGTVENFGPTVMSKPEPSAGSSDDFDFGDASGAMGLTSIVDSFGTTLLSVSYNSGSLNWQINTITLLPNSGQAKTISFGWNSGSSYAWPSLNSVTFPGINGAATQEQVTFSYAINSGSAIQRTPADDTDAGECACTDAEPSTVNAMLLSGISLTSRSGGTNTLAAEYSMCYNFSNYPSGNACPSTTSNNGALNLITVPTGGTIAYTFAAQGPTEGCTPFPPLDLETTDSPGGCTSEVEQPEIPQCDTCRLCRMMANNGAIATRTVTDPLNGVVTTTSYTRKNFKPGDPNQTGNGYLTRLVEVTEQVDGSSSRLTRYLFHNPDINSTPNTSLGGLELEHSVSVGTTFTNSPVRFVVNCTGLDDATGNPTTACGYLNSSVAGQRYSGVNARPQATVTWYGKPTVIGTTDLGACSEDTTPCVQDVSSSWTCYDIVGNYCGYGAYSTQAVSDANMVDSVDRRTTTTWAPFIDLSHWLLNLWTERVVSDGAPAANTSDGATVVRTYAAFDASNHPGFLNAAWAWDSPSQTVRQECRYPNGDGTVLKQFTQTAAWIGTGEPTNQCPGLGSIPSLGTDNDAFGKSFSLWQNGQLRKANWIKNASSIGWNSFDVDRDFASGMVMTSRDANAQATAYSYDALGRITQIQPPGTEKPTTFCYFLVTDSVGDLLNDVLVKKFSSSTATVCSPDDGAPAAGSGTLEGYQYDGLGRLVRHMRRFPTLLANGTPTPSYFSVKEFKYDVAGNMDYESEWTPCTPPSGAQSNINACSTLVAAGLSTTTNYATQWSSYDPFGRARHIQRADLTTTDIDRTDTGTSPSISYSDTLESVTVNGVGGGNPVTVTRKDPLGRVTSVTEPAVGGIADVTTYQYNVLDELTGVTQGSQARTFTFNAFGDLMTEISPEKGSVHFTSYGSLGNLRERQEGSGGGQATIDTSYDAAGRVSKECAGSSNCAAGTLYRMNCYDGSGTCPDGSPNFAGGTYPLGKLTRRFGYNPLFKPLFPSGSYSESLQEDFGYSQLGGRLSDKTYTITSGANTNAQETWTFNNLGLAATHKHPRVGASASFQEQVTYASGLPTTVTLSGTSIAGSAIPGAIVTATYGNAGQIATYSGHQIGASTLTTTISFDSTLIPRPSSIASSLGTFSTGSYAYDGAGNITTIGPDNFKYDARSRLTSALYSGQTTRCTDSLGNANRNQCFAYDRWANLTGVTGTGPRPLCTDSATNHLKQVIGTCPTLPGYDTRGNLTSYAPDTLAYDAVNRQVEDTQSGGADWQNLYNGSDERSIRTTQANSGASVTRREMARYLIEASDSPQLPSSCGGYPAIQDVPCSDPDWGYVEQALLDGITAGCQQPGQPLQYCPSNTILRSSMAVMLVVAEYTSSYTPPACQSTNPSLPGYNPFTDVSNTSNFCPFIAQIYHDGVTAGCNQNPPQYCPGNTVTEQQMTIFMSVYWPSYHPITTGATYTLRDDENRVVTQLTDSIPGRDNVYLGPLLVGSYVSDPTVDPLGWQFHSSDHLGTVRETWRVTPNTFEYHKYWPYGDEVGTNAAPAQKISFAAMERDVESNHYFDHARFHDLNLGRFVGVDRVRGGPLDPQTWNRYAYARSNPLRLTDPTGLYTSDCAIVELACAAHLTAFETERHIELRSKNARTREDAAAYGDPGVANGVKVGFADPGAGKVGSTDSYETISSTGGLVSHNDVTIRPGMDRLRLKYAVAHEGRHVIDAARYQSTLTITPDGSVNRNEAFHLTHCATEFNAFLDTQNVLLEYGDGRPYDFGCPGGCALGAGANVDHVITKILANPPYELSPGSLKTEGGYQVDFP